MTQFKWNILKEYESGTRKTQIKRKCLPKKMKTIFYLSYEKVEFRNNIDFNNNIS